MMQAIKYLNKWLYKNADKKHFLFRSKDLRALFPNLSESAFKTLLSRSVSSGILTRVCRGIYLFKETMLVDGLILFRVATLLRGDEFNYISLETILSENGVISQVPINSISVMSSGRSNIVSCGRFGNIEFIHTSRKPDDLLTELIYDTRYNMWKANVTLAIRDMKHTRRNCDLINWEVVNEFI